MRGSGEIGDRKTGSEASAARRVIMWIEKKELA